MRFSAPSTTLTLRVCRRRGDVLRRRIEHEVDLARQQRRYARAVLLDRRVDDLGRRCPSSLVPPVRVLHEHCLHVGFARLQHERAGAVGVARGEGLFLLRVVLRLDDVVLLGPGLAHDPHSVSWRSSTGFGTVGDDHRVVIDGMSALHADGVLPEVRRRLHRALDREHDVISGQRASRRETSRPGAG